LFYTIRLRRSSAYKFKGLPIKMVIYFTGIITARLLEIGINPIVDTKAFTHIIIAYLTITEAIDVLKKLTLLGLPLPTGFVRVIMRYLKSPTLEELFDSNSSSNNFIAEVNDIINYQIPNIHSEEIRAILRIKFEEWAHAIHKVDLILSETNSEVNDLIYYKLTSIMNTTRDIIEERWKEENLSQCCISLFNDWHKHRKEGLEYSLREICYSDNTMPCKKKLIIERIVTSLYQTIVDIQKEESHLLNNECCIDNHTRVRL